MGDTNSSTGKNSDYSEAMDAEAGKEFRVHVFSSASELLQKLHQKGSATRRQQYPAMYSSIFGGIIRDLSMMVIPIDDHMVHRGHGVFDTAIILDGSLYELDAHLERFLESAAKAKICSTFHHSALRTILIQLTAVSNCRNGTLRYWLSAGPGDFSLSPSGCPESAFYAVVIDESFNQSKEGIKAITSTVPMKHPMFSTMKSVNYLPNVLAQIEAEESGAHASIWIDDQGYIAEGPNMNVAFVTQEKELVLPLFDKILSGCTAKRLLKLAAKLVEQGNLKSVKTANVTVREAKLAAEMMFVGSTLPVLPIVVWDGQAIGNGEVGETTMVLSDLLWNDMVAGPDTQRFPVPYTH